MTGKTEETLKELKNFFLDECDTSFSTYRTKNNDESFHRFWNLIRADLMRMKPDDVAEYLKKENTKLSEMDNFGTKIAEKYFSDGEGPKNLRCNQEALIYACIEMDAALKLKESIYGNKSELSNKLKLWRIS